MVPRYQIRYRAYIHACSDEDEEMTNYQHIYPNVLFITHGRHHRRCNPGYKVLEMMPERIYRQCDFIDSDDDCYPTVIADVKECNIDIFDKQFDYIFCMYTPCDVLKSKQFWHNVSAWLKPGGIVQTILPRFIYRKYKERVFGSKISNWTRLSMVKKDGWFIHPSQPGIVLMKNYTYC